MGFGMLFLLVLRKMDGDEHALGKNLLVLRMMDGDEHALGINLKVGGM